MIWPEPFPPKGFAETRMDVVRVVYIKVLYPYQRCASLTTRVTSPSTGLPNLFYLACGVAYP